MKKLKRIVVVLFSGFIGMLMLWAVAFFLAPKTTVPVYLYPGKLLLPLWEFIPSNVVYFLFPFGGLEATVGITFLFAALVWWLFGSVIAYFALNMRSSKKRTAT